MIAFITGSGRCGTHTLTAFLDGQRRTCGTAVSAKHETDANEMIDDMLRGRFDLVRKRTAKFSHDIEVNPYLLFLPELPFSVKNPAGRILGLIRDGRKTVRSGMTNGWYWNPRVDCLRWVRLMPQFSDCDRFSACCRFWSWTYSRLENWGVEIFRLEDLLRSRSSRFVLLSRLGLQDSDSSLPFHNRTEYRWNAASESTADVDWPSPFPDFNDWSGRELRVFDRSCGNLMDKYYPNWREG